jgi:hypothetical protein
VATSWDGYLNDLSYDPGYSYQPSYQPDDGYDQPSYNYASDYSYDPAYDPNYGYEYGNEYDYQPEYQAAPSYDPYNYDAMGGYGGGYEAAPPVQQYTAPEYVAPTPDYEYEASQPSVDPGYTTGEQFGGGYSPPAPDNGLGAPVQNLNFGPFSDPQPANTASLYPAVDPSRNPQMPAPSPVVAAAPALPDYQAQTEESWQQGTSQAFTEPIDYGVSDFLDATAQGPQIVADAEARDQRMNAFEQRTPPAPSLNASPTTSPSLSQFQTAIGQGPQIVAEAEQREDLYADLRDDQALRQAGLAHGGTDPYSYDAMGGYGGYNPTPPQSSWIGDRANDLGTWGREAQDSLAPGLDALGTGFGAWWERGTDPYRRTAPQVATDVNTALPEGPNVDLGQFDPTVGVTRPISTSMDIVPWEQVETNTPVLGGVKGTLDRTTEAFGQADNVGDRLGALATGVADIYGQPLAWAQERRAGMAYDIARGDPDARYFEIPGLPSGDLPIVGNAFRSIDELAYHGTPEFKAELVRVHDEAEASDPGSGPRAVWEWSQNPAFRNTFERLAQDTVNDPLPAYTGGTRLFGSGLSAVGRGMQASGRPIVSRVGTGIRTTGALTEAAGGVADELIDMGLTAGLGVAGRGLRSSRLGQLVSGPFQLTDEAAAEQTVSQHADAVGGLIATNRGPNRLPPPAPGATQGSPNGTPPNGTIPPEFNDQRNTTTSRYGDYRVIQRNDTGEVIITDKERSRVITPNPLTQDEAAGVMSELRAGATIEEANLDQHPAASDGVGHLGGRRHPGR